MSALFLGKDFPGFRWKKIVSLPKLQELLRWKLEGSAWAGDVSAVGSVVQSGWSCVFILGVDHFVLRHLWFWMRLLPAEGLRWMEEAWGRCQTALPGRIPWA